MVVAEPARGNAAGGPESRSSPPAVGPAHLRRRLPHQPSWSTIGPAVDFVCEDDVRQALRAGRRIRLAARAIVTPAARELGDTNECSSRRRHSKTSRRRLDRAPPAVLPSAGPPNGRISIQGLGFLSGFFGPQLRSQVSACRKHLIGLRPSRHEPPAGRMHVVLQGPAGERPDATNVRAARCSPLGIGGLWPPPGTAGCGDAPDASPGRGRPGPAGASRARRSDDGPDCRSGSLLRARRAGVVARPPRASPRRLRQVAGRPAGGARRRACGPAAAQPFRPDGRSDQRPTRRSALQKGDGFTEKPSEPAAIDQLLRSRDLRAARARGPGRRADRAARSGADVARHSESR